MKRIGLGLIWPLLILACAYSLIRYWWAVVQNPEKAKDIAWMIDNAANVSLNGRPNTSISGRAGRAALRGEKWGCLLCWVLDKIDPDHCTNVVVEEADIHY